MDIPLISLDELPKIRFKVDTLSFHQGFTKQSVILVPKDKAIKIDLLPPDSFNIDLQGKIELNFNWFAAAEYFDLGREFYIEFHRIQ
ncbi:hypothetical protein [Nostoc sp. FACHB-280]|uniref:hypothetical protein n=1 Tax=Nostoc sp. FACHB-280 TaxID=2692839 RepID=UPI00168A56D6|nr:hypothetical protein [Nostoc sp. FACHB-280]MBD2495013.1 hypothetical protein [Nostoc sp. FACHB-280]